MLWHVYQRAMQAQEAQGVWVATDSQEIYDAVCSWGGKAIMTSPECTCGTERIASIVDELDGDIVVNVQGDEPLIEPALIDQLIEAARQSGADMVTPVTCIRDLETLTNPNSVKVVRSSDGLALYFSRSPVPFIRDVPLAEWPHHSTFWLQVGTYAFTREVLREYRRWEESPLEKLEKVEQLRFLEHGKRILTVVTEFKMVAVDVQEDLERVRGLMAAGSRVDGDPRR